MAGWIGIQGEKEDDNGSQRTGEVDGRIVHEKISKTGGANEFSVVLGDRFVVSAKGHGVGIGELKSAALASPSSRRFAASIRSTGRTPAPP